MLKLVEGVVDVAGHTEIACAIEIIPVEVDATEAFAGPVDVDFFVMVAEALDEVVSMFSAHIFYAKNRRPRGRMRSVAIDGATVQVCG